MSRPPRHRATGAPEGDPRARFAAEVATVLREQDGVDDVTLVAGDFAIDVVSGEQPHRLFLDSLYAETRELSAEERRERVLFFVHDILHGERELTWEQARAALVPVLRGATYGIDAWARDEQAWMVRRPFLPFLDVMPVIDTDTSMTYVSRATLETWGVREDDVFAALEERMSMLRDPEITLYDDTHGPLWSVTTDDTYESSRLLLPGWLASFRGKVEGRPLAVVPERATLLIGGGRRPEMVRRLLDKASREWEGSTRRISPAPYTVDEQGQVVPFFRRKPGKLAGDIQIAHHRLAAFEYGTQKEALDTLHGETGEDVFLASYKTFQRDDDFEVRSLTTWVDGIDSYLPRADRVVLLVPAENPEDRPRSMDEVPWEAVQSRLERVEGVHPARYRPGQFPTKSERRAMLEGNTATRPARGGGATQ
jgi:hypothetical protein